MAPTTANSKTTTAPNCHQPQQKKQMKIPPSSTQGQELQKTTVEQQPLLPTSPRLLQPLSRRHAISCAGVSICTLHHQPGAMTEDHTTRGRRGTFNTSEKDGVKYPKDNVPTR